MEQEDLLNVLSVRVLIFTGLLRIEVLPGQEALPVAGALPANAEGYKKGAKDNF